MLILLVFLVSYGVARQAIMHPRSEWNWSILGKIFFVPYWQVYGELFPDEDKGELFEVIRKRPSETEFWLNSVLKTTGLQ